MTARKWPDHAPTPNGGCLVLSPCTCQRADGRHCGNCGRAIDTEPGRALGSSHTFHVGMRERLAELNEERRAAAGKPR